MRVRCTWSHKKVPKRQCETFVGDDLFPLREGAVEKMVLFLQIFTEYEIANSLTGITAQSAVVESTLLQYTTQIFHRGRGNE